MAYLIFAPFPLSQPCAEILQLLAPLDAHFKPLLQSFHRQSHRALVAPHIHKAQGPESQSIPLKNPLECFDKLSMNGKFLTLSFNPRSP